MGQASGATRRMRWLLLALQILATAWPGHAIVDTCDVCGRRPLAPHHGRKPPLQGGTNAQPGAWPWIVSLQLPTITGHKHTCGGSLITARWVLTAAHCFANKRNLPHWRAVIGASKLSSLGAEVHVRFIKQVVIYKGYKANLKVNDIALMELDQPIKCSDYIQPACLPKKKTNVSTLNYCFIGGWGVLRKHEAKVAPNIMQEAKVNRFSTALCNSSKWYNGAIQPHTLCAGYEEGGIDSCQGDSGGPLMCKEDASQPFWVVGVTSWGHSCGKARKPGVYTSTQHFYGWMKKWAGPMPQPPPALKPKYLFSPPETTTTPQPTPETTTASTPPPPTTSIPPLPPPTTTTALPPPPPTTTSASATPPSPTTSTPPPPTTTSISAIPSPTTTYTSPPPLTTTTHPPTTTTTTHPPTTTTTTHHPTTTTTTHRPTTTTTTHRPTTTTTTHRPTTTTTTHRPTTTTTTHRPTTTTTTHPPTTATTTHRPTTTTTTHPPTTTTTTHPPTTTTTTHPPTTTTTTHPPTKATTITSLLATTTAPHPSTTKAPSPPVTTKPSLAPTTKVLFPSTTSATPPPKTTSSPPPPQPRTEPPTPIPQSLPETKPHTITQTKHEVTATQTKLEVSSPPKPQTTKPETEAPLETMPETTLETTSEVLPQPETEAPSPTSPELPQTSEAAAAPEAPKETHVLTGANGTVATFFKMLQKFLRHMRKGKNRPWPKVTEVEVIEEVNVAPAHSPATKLPEEEDNPCKEAEETQVFLKHRCITNVVKF